MIGRFNEQSNLINFTSLGTLAIFLLSLLTFTEEPSQIGWFWFFSVSFVGFSGLAFRKVVQTRPPTLEKHTSLSKTRFYRVVNANFNNRDTGPSSKLWRV